MAIKKGLGRGLDLLIPKEEKQENKAENNSQSEKKEKEDKLKEYDQVVDINKIEPNRNQPRKQFDEDAIEELTESIKQYGVIQPLIVKEKDGFYEIIAGERRWRASKKAGLKEVPVIIRDYNEDEILKISLIENLQRENLNAIEEAKAYQQLQEQYNLKQDEIAQAVSKSRTSITNTMRLLKLDDKVQKMIIDNRISSGHGRSLLPIEDKERQYQTAITIMDNSMSVREAERLVKKVLKEIEEEKLNSIEEETDEKSDQMIVFYEGKLKDVIGTKVKIKNRKNNKGRIEIEYYSSDELERIIELLQNAKQ